MKKILIKICFVLLISSCKNNEKPIAVFDKSEINFDTVLRGGIKSNFIKVKNIGTEKLIIEKFSSSCECTIPELKENTIISPKDSLSIKITVKGYKEDSTKWKLVLCTFKTNADSIFHSVKVKYYTK
jgi:Protein of unknown function (DUF1573)